MYKQLKKNQGFTIIEVMIVLAIAGLILLIVFLAVPALQRNARNTSMKNDASSLAGAVSEFESNNSGTPPTGVTNTAGAPVITGAAGTISATAKTQSTTSVSLSVVTAVTAVTATVNKIQIQVGVSCSGTVNTRSTAVWYPIEQSGGNYANACVDA